MEEEKKTYAPGTVTISSEEYRDILTEAFDAKKDAEKWNTKYWDEYRAKRNLEEENAKLREQVAKLEKELASVKEESEMVHDENLVSMLAAAVKGQF